MGIFKYSITGVNRGPWFKFEKSSRDHCTLLTRNSTRPMMRPSAAGGGRGGCPLLRGGGKDLQSWDNFLDFSRFIEPRCGWQYLIAKRRLSVNLQTFALNYVISAFLGMTFLGFLIFNRRIVVSSLLVAAVYHLGLLVPVFAPSDLQMPSNAEKAFLMVMASNIIFFQFGVWRLGVFLSSIIALLALGHAVFRVVPGELDWMHHYKAETAEETVEFDYLGDDGGDGSSSKRGDNANGLHRRRPRPLAVPGAAVKMTSLDPTGYRVVTKAD